MRGEGSLEAYLVKKSQLNSERIQQFCSQEKYYSHFLTQREGVVLLLDPSSSVTDELNKSARPWLEQKAKEPSATMGICDDIARRAVNAGISDSILFGVSKLEVSGAITHCMNMIQLKDGSFVAFDLTAADNIDAHQGNFGVLALHAPTQEELLLRINRLYGDGWKVIQPRRE